MLSNNILAHRSGSRIEIGGGQGAKFLVMTLCLGPGEPKVLFWYMFSYAKGEKFGPGGHDPRGPLWMYKCYDVKE